MFALGGTLGGEQVVTRGRAREPVHTRVGLPLYHSAGSQATKKEQPRPPSPPVDPGLSPGATLIDACGGPKSHVDDGCLMNDGLEPTTQRAMAPGSFDMQNELRLDMSVLQFVPWILVRKRSSFLVRVLGKK